MARLFSFLDDPVPYYSVFVYLTVVYLLIQYVQPREPLLKKSTLKLLLALHNFFLCFLSIVMSAGLGYSVYNIAREYGWERAYCGVNDEVDAPIYFWINVFWLTKYYEFLDTVFLVLEKKTPIFLHVWHHSWVVIVPFVAIRHNLIMGWITAFNNCVVHIFMYFYYGYRSLGRDVWWRRYLTQLQIGQFALDNGSALLFAYFKLSGQCSGTWSSWLLGNFVGASFFVLFLQFYAGDRQYKAERQKKGQ